MSLVTADGLSLSFGKKVLFEDASFTIEATDRIGLIGPNGSGKSTLLRILSGEQQAEDGEVFFARGVRAGYLPQDILSLPAGSILHSVRSMMPDRDRLVSLLRGVEQELELAEDDETRLELSGRLAELHEAHAAFDARYGSHRAEEILCGLGFSIGDLERPVSELSGGWKMRAALAGLLLQGPELLLLDEPTNHLDLPSLQWFEDFLIRSKQALVLVSHDREFLNRQIGRVLAIEPWGLSSYPGDYDDYRRQRDEEAKNLELRAERQAARRAEAERFIDRFRAKASKARQVQSRIKQLEKQKKIRAEIDVLTLTATPIPRTLHMSMAGVRDLTIIQTPPADRRAIRTFVMKFDPREIREAILREKARGGQTFFVHNRVQSIGSMERFLKELIPEASIGVGHGQMPDHALERVISNFIERKFDVLLCTTIIESGLDIPNANTIVVNRADAFGLAQLYQLRGRVGRSSERAYAYLLVPKRQKITKDAQKRLEVLQHFSDLGAGFQIASHDLEIRGAGSLLGEKQSGQIESVGFELYVELLDEAVRELKGEPPKADYDPEVTLPVPAFIPDDYLPDVHQRLLFYKKLASTNTDIELEDVRAELLDRCGHPPPPVDALCKVMSIKAMLRSLRLRALESGPARLVLTLGPDPLLSPTKLTALLAQAEKRVTAGKKPLEPKYRLTPDMKLVARMDPDLAGEALLAKAEEILREVARCRA